MSKLLFVLILIFCVDICKCQDSLGGQYIKLDTIQKANIEVFSGKIYKRNSRSYYRLDGRIGNRAFDTLLGKSPNQEVRQEYKSYLVYKRTGNYFGVGGLALTVIGAVSVGGGLLNLLFSYPPSSPTSQNEDFAISHKLFILGITTGGIGIGGLTTCIVLKSTGKRKLKHTIDLYNQKYLKINP